MHEYTNPIRLKFDCSMKDTLMNIAWKNPGHPIPFYRNPTEETS